MKINKILFSVSKHNLHLFEINPPIPPLSKGGEGGFFIFIIMILFIFETFCIPEKIHADIISKIIGMQKNIKTMRADFIQEKYSQLLEKPIISRGIFFFSVPERFVWDYKDDMKVISDGKRLMLYYKKQQEADIMDISKFPSLPVSFSIENLTKRYRIEVLEAKSHTYILKVKPVIETMPIREILITLDEKATPIEVKMTERTGDSTNISFSNTKVNIIIPDETFSMKVPDGVHVRNNLK